MPAPLLYLVSACLCGVPCRYDGTGHAVPSLARLAASGRALLVCPESMAGLSTPRPPCEIHNGKVITQSGEEVTSAFKWGAALVLECAIQHRIRVAVLKEKSPSCGSKLIYDGSFSGRVIEGEGITAALLRSHGIVVWNEEHFQEDS